MHPVIVVQFMTLDGVVEDPDGRGGTPFGGWALRPGTDQVREDTFALGPLLDTGALLFGRRTWEHFSGLWPDRTTELAQVMNAATKVVVSHAEIDPGRWTGSRRLIEPLSTGVEGLRRTGAVVVIGSIGLAQALAAAGLVDEYRLLLVPFVAGSGRRLFEGAPSAQLDLCSVDHVGPGVLLTLRRSDAG